MQGPSWRDCYKCKGNQCCTFIVFWGQLLLELANTPILIQETLKELYIFNHLPQNWDLKKYSPGTKDKAGDQWGGARAQRLLGLAYTLAFLCLLRVDEVLNIQSQDLVVLSPTKLELTLPFRKTEQYGGVSIIHVADVWTLIFPLHLKRSSLLSYMSNLRNLPISALSGPMGSG